MGLDRAGVPSLLGCVVLRKETHVSGLSCRELVLDTGVGHRRPGRSPRLAMAGSHAAPLGGPGRPGELPPWWGCLEGAHVRAGQSALGTYVPMTPGGTHLRGPLEGRVLPVFISTPEAPHPPFPQ